MFNSISIKIPMTFIKEFEKWTLKCIWKHKVLGIVKATQQKEQGWMYHNTKIQIILQGHSNKHSMVVAQKQIWRQVEQNKRPRYESMQLYPSPDFWQRWQKHMMEKRQPLQQMMLGKLYICLQKTETTSTVVILYKDQLKVVLGPWY
jgi:hypothetical protein